MTSELIVHRLMGVRMLRGHDWLLWLVVVVGLLLASKARARTISSVAVPEQIRVGDRLLRLNGAGVHEVGIFHVDVYVGALYLEEPSSSSRDILESSQAKGLLLRFKRDVSRADLRDVLSALSKGHSPELARLFQRVRRLVKGDVLLVGETADHVIELRLNGDLIGRASGRALCRDLFEQWIGAHPLSPALRSKLLRQ